MDCGIERLNEVVELNPDHSTARMLEEDVSASLMRSNT